MNSQELEQYFEYYDIDPTNPAPDLHMQVLGNDTFYWETYDAAYTFTYDDEYSWGKTSHSFADHMWCEDYYPIE